MDLGEFTILLALNLDIYILYLSLAFTIYLTLYRKYYRGIFDPFLFFYVLVFAFCFANIFFLFHLGEIKFKFLLNFILCQFFFFLGFKYFKSYFTKIDFTKTNETISLDINIPYFIFIVCLIFFLLLQPSVYLFSGIPLFMKSRWETFDGSGGLGIIDRLLDVVRFSLSFSIFWLLYLDVKNNRLKFLCYLAILILLFTSVLNGSKMAILDYVFILSFVKLSFISKGYMNLGNSILKSQRILFFLSIIGAFYAVIVHYKVNDVEFGLDANDYTNPIYGFLLRFVYSGDVYIMAYPNEVIQNFEWYNPFLALFRNVIGMLRIVPWESLPKDIGFTIFEYFNPSSDIPRGPTMKFDIFGYFFFGSIGSYVFSFLIGLLLSYFINYRLKLNKSFTYYLTYSIFCYYIYLIPINPPVAISKLFNVFIFFICAKFLFKTIINFNFTKRYV